MPSALSMVRMIDSHLLNARIRAARTAKDTATLIAALSDEREGYLAARYLGDVGDQSAIPALLSRLEAPAASMRASVAGALGQLDATDAVPRLAGMARRDPDAYVRRMAMESAALLGGSEIQSALEEGLADASLSVRRAAAIALGRVAEEPRAAALLRKASRRDWLPGRRLYRDAIAAVRARSTDR